MITTKLIKEFDSNIYGKIQGLFIYNNLFTSKNPIYMYMYYKNSSKTVQLKTQIQYVGISNIIHSRDIFLIHNNLKNFLFSDYLYYVGFKQSLILYKTEFKQFVTHKHLKKKHKYAKVSVFTIPNLLVLLARYSKVINRVYLTLPRIKDGTLSDLIYKSIQNNLSQFQHNLKFIIKKKDNKFLLTIGLLTQNYKKLIKNFFEILNNFLKIKPFNLLVSTVLVTTEKSNYFIKIL